VSTWLIAGLGNPGREYQRTRHNVGFLVVENLGQRWGLSFTRHKVRAEIAEGSALGERVILAKPQTYMNQSGESVRGLQKLHNIETEHILIVYDEMDLPLGRLRLRDRGSSGGHRGMGSVIDHLHTDAIARLRVGVSRPPPDLDPIDYVLKPFSADEQRELPAIFERAASGIETLVRDGITAAMNAVNTVPKPAARADSSA
jgi:PTH1 family peptidyl-tRNA hydrolase